MGNKKLNNAKKAKQDEFYTQLVDIEKEMCYYKEYFKGKIVYCNCDMPSKSNFVRYFKDNFTELGLKKLIASGYIEAGNGRALIVTSDNEFEITLNGDGSFESDEAIEFLKESDVVVTNPPFSLFRKHIAQLQEYGKKYITMGAVNAIKYRSVFPLLQDNKLWLGHSIKGGDREFQVPKSYQILAQNYRTDTEGNRYVKVAGVRWFTNIDTRVHNEELILTESCAKRQYVKYSNYDIIEVSKTKDIPFDYDGVMGVPITFMDKYNPEQFEIVGISSTSEHGECKIQLLDKSYKVLYTRIFIKHLSPSKE